VAASTPPPAPQWDFQPVALLTWVIFGGIVVAVEMQHQVVSQVSARPTTNPMPISSTTTRMT
jgi:hypothetical protein